MSRNRMHLSVSYLEPVNHALLAACSHSPQAVYGIKLPPPPRHMPPDTPPTGEQVLR